ncbi:MAG: GGDEF domain-containing protein, partial [Methylosarcina sp.]
MNAGDELLKNIALLIKGRLKQKEVIARLGDKIFGILIKQCTDDEGYEIAKKIRASINNYHFEWKNKSYSIGVSMGLVSVNQGHTVDELLQQADSASITAKRSGHNRIRLYKDDDAGIKAQAG